MDPLNFVYWLRGYLEIAQPKKIKQAQIDIINKHLDLVLLPVTKMVDLTKVGYEKERVKGLKPAPPTPAELDEALGAVNRWYPPPNPSVFPRIFDGERVVASC